MGVFLKKAVKRPTCGGLPHARGGVSISHRLAPRLRRSSPRTWGCFSSDALDAIQSSVFPTHVGVFLLLPRQQEKQGIPAHFHRQCNAKAFGMSSPRTWGCFRFFPVRAHHTLVFPTHVGVFLPTFDKPVLVCRLPHARGGVSKQFVIVFFTALVFPTHVGVFLL